MRLDFISQAILFFAGCFIAGGLLTCGSEAQPKTPALTIRAATVAQRSRLTTAGSVSPSRTIVFRLERAVARARRSRELLPVRMTRVERRSWSRFYTFTAGTRKEVDRALGFAWDEVPAQVPRRGHDESLLVFTRAHHVVGFAFYPSKQGEFDCVSNAAGWKPGIVFTVQFSPGTSAHRPTPVFTTMRGGAHQRSGLRTFGIT